MFSYGPEWGFRQYIAAAMLLILVLTRVFRKKEFVRKYKDLSSIIIFITISIILGVEFYQKKIYVGLVVLALAAVALGKVFYDRYKDGNK